MIEQEVYQTMDQRQSKKLRELTTHSGTSNPIMLENNIGSIHSLQSSNTQQNKKVIKIDLAKVKSDPIPHTKPHTTYSLTNREKMAGFHQ